MGTPPFKKWEENIIQSIFGSVKVSVFCNTDLGFGLVSHVGMLQVFSNMTALWLNADANLYYSVDVVYLSLHAIFRRFLMAHSYKAVSFLPFGSEVRKYWWKDTTINE